MHGERGKNCGKVFVGLTSVYTKKKGRREHLPILRDAKFIKFGLTIVIAVGSEFDHICGSYQKYRKQMNYHSFALLDGYQCQYSISVAVLYFK